VDCPAACRILLLSVCSLHFPVSPKDVLAGCPTGKQLARDWARRVEIDNRAATTELRESHVCACCMLQNPMLI